MTYRIIIEIDATLGQAETLFEDIADWAHNGDPIELPDIRSWSPAVSLAPLDDHGIAAAEQAAKDYITRLQASGEPFVDVRWAVRVPSWMVGEKRRPAEAMVCVAYEDSALGADGRLSALATDRPTGPNVRPMTHYIEHHVHDPAIWTEWTPGDDE